jgi:hypothetical protein
MWTQDSKPTDWGNLQLSPAEVLYYYDEPLIFTAAFGPATFIVYKVASGNGFKRFLTTSTFHPIIAALKTGRLSLRGALDQATFWVLDTDDDLNVIKAWEVAEADLPPKFLPKRGLGLFAAAGRSLPDSLQQADAFFSVKFAGAGLTTSVIKFSRFKTLVDNVYESVKKILPPLVVEGRALSRDVDYDIFPPKLASLVISIKEPIVNVAKIQGRSRSKVNLNPADFTEHFLTSRDDFILRMNDVVAHAEKGDLRKGYAAENFDTLDQISDIMPSSHSSFDKVEFRAASAGSNMVRVESRVGERIRLAHKIAEADKKIVTGVVIEVNRESATFVLKNRLQRQITCVLSREFYDQTEPMIGATVRLRGDFIKRTRRDKIIVDGLPEIDP